MKNKKVLVFGSNGMLGAYFSNMLLEQNVYEVVRNDKSLGGIDITDEKAVMEVIKEVKPYFVVNCAAYTNVEKAEDDRELAFKVNADAPKYMANVCRDLDISFIHISTDYVFGDNKEDGYTEEYSHFNPLNVYGQSKLKGELNVLESKPDSYIFRTSWLFGPNATNFIDKILKYAKELPELKVVTDEIGCPTYVKDLSEAMLLALNNEIEPGIYHLCSSNHISRYEFAKEILSVVGIPATIKECKLKDFPRKAKIPNISILVNTKLKKARTSYEMLQDYFGV
jgi:dTDP-4-dehydrorhamnose reductase